MPFGFDHNKSAFLQLLKILGIPEKSKRAGNLQESLRTLGRTHLDINLAPGCQTEALERIRTKLQEDCPDLFDKDEKEMKLYYATNAIKQSHNNWRVQIRREAEKRGLRRPSAESYGDKTEIIDLSDVRSDDSEEVIVVRTRASMETSRRVTVQSVGVLNQHSAVQEFLDACEPPMGHFLQAFIDFGCTTSQYLHSFAMFTPETRNRVLRRLLHTCMGDGGFTEMDIAILDDHFISSFP